MKLKLGILLFLSLLVLGCSKMDYQELMKKEDYIIVDVRTKEEYNISHIKNAVNIPYDTIDKEIEIDKSKNIFVYCQSGTRSKIAYDKLKKLGYKVYDLKGIDEIDLPREKE